MYTKYPSLIKYYMYSYILIIIRICYIGNVNNEEKQSLLTENLLLQKVDHCVSAEMSEQDVPAETSDHDAPAKISDYDEPAETTDHDVSVEMSDSVLVCGLFSYNNGWTYKLFKLYLCSNNY